VRTISILAVVLVAIPALGDDWPQWLGAKRDGVWRETGIVEKFPSGGPKVLWRQALGPGYSGPAVVGDRLYVMDRPTSAGAKLKDSYAKEAAPGKERVLCLDAQSGKELWKHEYDCPYQKLSYPSGPRCTPLVHEDKVYSLGAMGHLFCLDAKSGKVLWSKVLPAEYKTEQPIWGYSAHPLIDGKKLITLVGGDGSAVVALDKDSGKEIWKALTSQEICYSPPIIVEAGGTRQLIVWLSDTLNSVDPETGKQYWMAGYPEDGKPQRPAVNIAQALHFDDLVYVTSAYHGVLAMKLAKDKPTAEVAYRGKDKNMTKAEGLHSLMVTPVEREGYVYGVGPMGELRCQEAATGKLVWKTQQPLGGKDALFGTVFLTPNADRFFLWTDQGDLIIAKLSPKGYEELDRVNLLKPSQFARGRDVVWSHPAYARRCVFARNDNEIICVNLAKE
jgi:outer membrane protein assembly factor BamB